MQTDDTARRVENVTVELESGMHFVGDAGGFRVDTDAGESFGGAGGGPQPLRLLLLGAAERQRVSGLAVEARGSRVDEHPRVYRAIELVYRVRGEGIDPKAVERAIELSETRYCPAIAMVGHAASIDSRYEIEETD